jgi:hypothetical protein
MQQAQQREQAERISWARAMVFAVGFFFIAAILIGQLPGYVNLLMTAASLTGLEQGMLALAAVCFGGFIIIQVIVLLFDPKPLVPPIIFSVLGVPLAIIGLAIMLAASYTNNQYFPSSSVSWNPLLNGKVLWFQDGAVDFVMIGAVVLWVGVAMAFYSVLALREQRNPDRSDPGTTSAIRGMISAGVVLLILFMFFYTFVSDSGLAKALGVQQYFVDLVLETILGIAIFCTLGAFALRLHYLMRPVRKRTMAQLYLVGVNIVQVGVIFLIAWIVAYPLIAWIHSWTFIGLGDYLTLCAKKSAVPQSCSFSQQAGYIVDAIITTNNFVLLMASVWAWKTHRNLVIIAGVTITAILALATLLTHTSSDQVLIALLLCGGALVLAAIWTSTARREFAVVGERNLGCVGMWLVVGTCLFIYIAAFGFFSIPGFHETEPNIPFLPGVRIPGGGDASAVILFVIVGVLAAIQFYFLVRNRYKV